MLASIKKGRGNFDTPPAGFGSICHTFATGYKNGVMPGHRNIPMSVLRQFLLSTFHHDVMSICQEEKRRPYCKYGSFSRQAPEMSGPRENDTVPADSLPVFFRHGFGPAGGAGMFSEWHDNFTIWETIGTRHRRDLKRTGQQNDY